MTAALADACSPLGNIADPAGSPAALDVGLWIEATAELEAENAELRRVAHELFFAYLRLLERVELLDHAHGLIERRWPQEVTR